MLNGIRIIDFSQYLPGPYASLRLADMGAEVIKIEPQKGDPARHLGDKRNGTGIIFLANNRNKKSITLNLKEEDGRNIALELIKKADVVIESFRPGVMQRLGLGYEDVKKVKEDIIYCSITGFGQNTAYSHIGSHDINYVALSGILSQLKDDNGKPVHPTITLADLTGGIVASEAILGAIIQRFTQKRGTYLDISLTDVMISLMNNHVLMDKEKGKGNGLSELTGSIVSYHIYETKDGRYISLGALELKFWANFCHAIGKDDWISAHTTLANEENVIYNELKDIFLSHTLDEWLAFMQKVDCCLAPVFEVGELERSQIVMDRGLMGVSQEGYLEVATSYDEEFKEMTSKSPKLGEHNQEILHDVLGFSKEKIEEFIKKKIV